MELAPICAVQLNEEGSEHFLLSHKDGEYRRSAGSWTYDWNNVNLREKSSSDKAIIYDQSESVVHYVAESHDYVYIVQG